MANEYPRLISWHYYDGRNVFSKAPEKEEIIEYYILDKDGEQEIADGTLTNMKTSFNKVSAHFKRVVKMGYTKKSRKYRDIYHKMKSTYPELEDKIKPYNDTLKDCGSYVYVYLPYINNTFADGSFASKHKDVFLNGNTNYIKKEFWTVDLINDILNYKPCSIFGNEITEYQEKYMPMFLLNVKKHFPALYENLDRKTDKDERELLLGKYVPLKTLKPGIVGDVQGVVLLADRWNYDGEYLTAGEEYGNITVEHRIKANGDVKVRVIDINTVPVGRES